MVKLLTSLCIALCLTFAASLAAKAQSADEKVAPAYAAWDEAFNKRDAKALAAFYTDNTLFLPASHDIIREPAGVEKFFASIFEMGVTGHKLELIETQEAGETVYGLAKWSAKGKDATGADQPWGGVATHIFERQVDGTLKIRLHMFN
jgi:ketosteroid isomerase-like protein